MIFEKKACPGYVKFACILIIVCLLVVILKQLQNILIPFAIAALLAVLFNPLNKQFERKMPRMLAVLLTVIVWVVLLGWIIFFISYQISLFSDSWSILQQKFTELFSQLQGWLLVHLNISMEHQAAIFSQAANDNTQIVTQTLWGIYGTLLFIILIPFYVFLLLFYKPLLVEFLFSVSDKEHAWKMTEILWEAENTVQSYIVGVLIETTIVASLNISALLILGVKYAVLLWLLGGLINMLPYVGGIVSVLLPTIVVFMTNGTISTEIAVLISYAIIQFIDNDILVPHVVSSKVKINALVSVIFLLFWAALWGIPGMFLSLPCIWVMKIILDRVEGLKPWGKLLGIEVPTKSRTVKRLNSKR